MAQLYRTETADMLRHTSQGDGDGMISGGQPGNDFTHQIKIISWDKAALDAYVKERPYFGKVIYPPNHFKGVDYEVLTVDNGVQLVTHADTPEALVYKLAKAIIENLDCTAKIFKPMKALNPKHCSSKLGNPFHPGSIKYFKEAGLM